jgi:hypothetical protein
MVCSNFCKIPLNQDSELHILCLMGSGQKRAQRLMRQKRLAEELIAASRHLDYELRMLEETALKLSTRGCGDHVTTNAILESFAMHARSIIWFLYPQKQRYPTDVLAEDYVPTWPQIRPRMPKTLVPLAARVNKSVAHLSYDRNDIVDEAKSWLHVQIARDIGEVIRRFIDHAPKSFFCEQMNERRELPGRSLLDGAWPSTRPNLDEEAAL